MQRPVRRLWIAAGLIVAVILLAAGVLWQTGSAQRKERDIALEQTVTRASQLAGAVAGRFDALARSMDFMLFWFGAEYGVNGAEFQAVSKSLVASFPHGALQEVAVAGPDGKLAYSSLGLAGPVSIREQQYFKTHLGGSDRIFIGKPIVGRLTNTWSIPFTRPIVRRGRLAGVVVVLMSAQYISQVLASFETQPEDNVTLLDTDGTFMAHSQKLNEVIGKTVPKRPFMEADGPQRGNYSVASFTDGRNRIFAWERIPGTSLVASVGLDERKALASLESHFRQAWTVAIAFALAILAFGFLVLTLLIRLSRRQQAVVASEARFRAIYEQAGVGVGIVAAGDGRWLNVNQRLCDIVGYTQQEMLASSFLDITPPEDRQAHVEHQRRARAGEIPSFTMEKRYLRKDGATVWVSISSSLVRDEAGAPDYFISVYEDITDRKRAEERLRELHATLEQRITERTVQLEEANRQLESFSYSVSHDLRAPLRAIIGFTDTLAHDAAPKLNENERKLFERIRSNAGRMSALIDDLLEFSHMSRSIVNAKRFPLRTLVDEIVGELREAYPQTEVRVSELPEITADRQMLRQALVNLVSNALKFSARADRPGVEIGCSVAGGETVYFVRDNGAGFDMRYADKLFGVFQRLHKAEEFPGTGVGLAIVYQVIQRHGGRVWAESAPEQGATFFFTLA